MARSPYGGDKRRREIARKKKREAKLARKHSKAEGGSEGTDNEQDTSYLEYLYPGGVPEELLPDSEDESEETSEENDE